MDNYMLQRRYVGNNETAAYVAQDFADSFSIGKYGNRFIWKEICQGCFTIQQRIKA